MKKLANFTLHDQTEYKAQWFKFGFDIDPKPRSPLVEYEKEIWTEQLIWQQVKKIIDQIIAEKFEYIMIGGLSNVMAYAWMYAYQNGLTVIMSKTPRLRTPDGKFIFKLTGYAELLTINELR